MTDPQRCEPPNLVVKGCTVHNTVTLDLALVRALVEALERMVGQWGLEACPVCGGDCASANPPISMCPMIAVMQAQRALARAKEAGL